MSHGALEERSATSPLERMACRLLCRGQPTMETAMTIRKSDKTGARAKRRKSEGSRGVRAGKPKQRGARSKRPAGAQGNRSGGARSSASRRRRTVTKANAKLSGTSAPRVTKSSKRRPKLAARTRTGADQDQVRRERAEPHTPPFSRKESRHWTPTDATAVHKNRTSNEAIANTLKRRQLRHVQRKSRLGPLTRSSPGGRGNFQTRRRKRG